MHDTATSKHAPTNVPKINAIRMSVIAQPSEYLIDVVVSACLCHFAESKAASIPFAIKADHYSVYGDFRNNVGYSVVCFHHIAYADLVSLCRPLGSEIVLAVFTGKMFACLAFVLASLTASFCLCLALCQSSLIFSFQQVFEVLLDAIICECIE